jgi:hypothetical protein
MARSPTSQDAKNFHELLSRTVDRLSRDLGLVVFRKQNGQHLILACLYSTIMQSSRECLLLMMQPTITLPSVLRSVVEAYADLRAMIIDVDHGQRIIATFEKEKRRHLRSMINSTDNPYHLDVAQHIDPRIELAKVDAELARLTALGHRPMDNKSRFEWAGLVAEYESYYWLLCLEGHNSVTALEARHVIRKENGDYELIATKDANSPEEICRWCDALSRILIDATMRLYGFLGIKRLGQCEEDLRQIELMVNELFGPSVEAA